ncbi:hypothetical protein PDJAM_G00052320 [Pangasius djambal]|uniref:Uncharacterized protein n=1 Tax=Pangasius djambal TaxID=1691987 RepID=A0ACC5YWQ3_9TELE|nr:hypothetical protein [Pangasius djambal]
MRIWEVLHHQSTFRERCFAERRLFDPRSLLAELSQPFLAVPPSSGRDGPIHTGALSELHDRADHSSAHVVARQILSGGMNFSAWDESMWKSWPP